MKRNIVRQPYLHAHKATAEIRNWLATIDCNRAGLSRTHRVQPWMLDDGLPNHPLAF